VIDGQDAQGLDMGAASAAAKHVKNRVLRAAL
jgi:hypothetical protein